MLKENSHPLNIKSTCQRRKVDRDWLVCSRNCQELMSCFGNIFSTLLINEPLTRLTIDTCANFCPHPNSVKCTKSTQKSYELKLSLSKECTIDIPQVKECEVEKQRWHTIIAKFNF